MFNIRWVKNTAKYATGERLVLGAIPVGAAFYCTTLSKGDAPAWDWRLDLPGKERAGRRLASYDEAKAACEVALADWLKAAGVS